MEPFEIKPGIYRHFKGNRYKVLCTARNSETLEPMVVYMALYGEHEIWVRPLSMWNETVEKDGMNCKRFEYVGPDTVIRSVKEEDREYILSLNESNVEFLSPMDKDKFAYFTKESSLFLVAEADSRPVGFLIALREGSSYNSENYIWFRDHYEQFIYIDRIVIDAGYRHLGIGKMLYDSVFDYAKKFSIPFVTAEIDTVPYNETSLSFHQSEGFEEVGRQTVRNGSVEVSLQAFDMEKRTDK